MMHFDSLQGWLAWQENLHPKPIDLGLERVTRVFRALNPQGLKPPTITVAGTNGKGSCIAFLEAIYRAQGYRVGAYTSPHIVKYNERIKVGGQPVDDAQICAAFERIEAVRHSVSLSYFEFGTLAALDIFRRSEVNVQLLEVGLGGRLDAVNIIDTDAAIVSSICIDHCDWLGETREAIGSEKAGIFRAGKPAIIGDPEPPGSLLDCARHKQTRLQLIGRDFGYRKKTTGWDWFSGDKILHDLPFPALQGEHQFRNAAAVLVALNVLQPMLPVSVAAIEQGLSQVRLAGRFQFIADAAVPVLLDVGHNPQAARTLLEHVTTVHPQKTIHAVFAMMKDKDIKGVIEIMRPVVRNWYISPLNNPRAADPEAIRAIFAACGVDRVASGFKDFTEAFAAAEACAGSQDLILVFGSFFLVSEYLSRYAVTRY
ncbi:MAG: bifunctional tetrahydrofolate synthase/dihydrofolate synthase [Gammaproteobacteria bacterium]